MSEGKEPEVDAGDERPVPNARRRWAPEASVETAAVLRLLAVQPWLVSPRDDAAIAAVLRNLERVQEALERLGWILVRERNLIRLRKSPPLRREAWKASGPSPREASWFFLIVAASEGAPSREALATVVTAARAAAAEAGLPTTNDIAERRAIVRAFKMLAFRGVIEPIDGEIEGFEEDENAPVLLAIHHSRLAHVIANLGTTDPSADPEGWLQQVAREPDPARRMRRRLVDDALVHACDLDDAEADWLSRRVRGDDGEPLAAAFGLHLERRAEGAAFVVPSEAFHQLSELGDYPFPSPGTVPHAALLLCQFAEVKGEIADVPSRPGDGWRGLRETQVVAELKAAAKLQSEGQGGWRRELAENPADLARVVLSHLSALDLVRVVPDANGDSMWWFSPATGRWVSPSNGTGKAPRRAMAKRPTNLGFEFAMPRKNGK